MQSSSFWSRAFLSVLACLGTGTQIAAAADSTKPALSISWKSITIRDIEKEEKKANESSKQGPIDFELNGGKLKYRLGGLRVEGNAIIMDTAQVDLNYEEIKGKNVLIVDIPEVTVRMVRKEKDVFGKKIVYDEPVTETKTRRERKETVLFAFKNPGIIAEKKKDFPWSLPLPKTLKIEISADEKTGTNRVQILESKEIIAQLQKAIDESFSDKILGDVLTYRLVNVPKEIEGVLRLKIDGEKATFFNNLRTALKQEVEKPTFIQNLQGSLAKQIPPLALNGEKLSGEVLLSPDLTSYSKLNVGLSDQIRNKTSRFDSPAATIRIATNTAGVNLVFRSYLNAVASNGDLTRQLKLGSAFEVNKETGILKFTVEKDTDREELAAVLSALNGENIDAKDISAIGLDLKGKWSKPETRFLHNGEKRGFALSLNLLVFSRRESDEAIRIPVAFAFSADSSGALNLESIRSSSTRKPVAACPTMRTLLAGMKLELIRLLLDQNLRGTEKQKIVVDIAEGKENESERVLIFQILPK